MINIFKRNTPSYQIPCDYLEKQIELDVSNYLGFISNVDSHFKLSDENEAITGADARFDCAFPMYLQFKTSLGLESVNKIKPSSRRNRSQLENIRIFRNENNLNDNPSLCFQLRAKAQHADDFQHNILMNYNMPGISFAFYVAPLCIKKVEYEKALFDSRQRCLIDFPFIYHDELNVLTKNGIRRMGTIPFLRQHVSIIPHERIDTEKHYYSYSVTGSDIAWHSEGDVMPYSTMRLSDVLQDIFIHAFSSKNNWMSIQNLSEKIIQLSEVNKLNIDLRQYESPLNLIKEHGQILYSKYKIKQFLFMTTYEYLEKIKYYT